MVSILLGLFTRLTCEIGEEARCAVEEDLDVNPEKARAALDGQRCKGIGP